MRRLMLHLALWFLSRLAPEGQRESLTGDLLEEYALRARVGSSAAALGWCLRQVCASTVPLLRARLLCGAWLSTLGVAVLGYAAVGALEFAANRVMPGAHAAGMIITFPAVVAIAYVAAGVRRRAPIVLGAMMLVAVTGMTLTITEDVPTWYRVALFFVGPAAVGIGSAWRRTRV
jgi:hypothetical protein